MTAHNDFSVQSNSYLPLQSAQASSTVSQRFNQMQLMSIPAENGLRVTMLSSSTSAPRVTTLTLVRNHALQFGGVFPMRRGAALFEQTGLPNSMAPVQHPKAGNCVPPHRRWIHLTHPGRHSSTLTPRRRGILNTSISG